MTDFNQWLENLKRTDSEVKDSVEKLEKYFAADGFDTQAFEGILNKGLSSIEISVPKIMKPPINANN
jgi:hypothetical protein